MCMCQQHIELQIVFKDCTKFCKKVLDAREEGTEEAGVEVYSSVSGMIEQTLCPLQEGQNVHKLQCLNVKSVELRS